MVERSGFSMPTELEYFLFVFIYTSAEGYITRLIDKGTFE